MNWDKLLEGSGLAAVLLVIVVWVGIILYFTGGMA